jgi:para-aminobenzoate synthetase component 1
MSETESPRLFEVPYRADSSELFAPLARWPWAVFLDSGRPHSDRGSYDLVAAEPVATVVTRGLRTEVRRRGHSTLSADDPFDILRRELGHPATQRCELPFAGGAIGYFGYELARRIENLPRPGDDPLGMPEMAVGIYRWAVLVDHTERRTRLVAQHGVSSQDIERLLELFSSPQPQPSAAMFQLRGDIHANMDRRQYGERFRTIKRYIRAGDCYQVNFAQRFNARVTGDPWASFAVLRAVNPAPFAAYLNTPGGQVLSISPERFLRLAGRQVVTQPIKGTRPRGFNPMHDLALAADLRESAKDRAENLMIVDLLRNDLGKTCLPGSIAVPRLFALESFPNVHHLVSTVCGTLPTDRDGLHLLRGCFPGGSITGAPKLRAMQIIRELEPDRRGVYCGSIGYLSSHGAMDTSIAIRTLVHRNGVVHFHAGGGIVADSQEDREYRECFHKVSMFHELLNHVSMDNVGS